MRRKIGAWGIVAMAAASVVLDRPAVAQTTPYVVPLVNGVTTQTVLTVGASVNGYRMVGIPDGLGAFDNGNGTFTLLMNHELGAASGITRAHGGTGSFVSRWVINKTTLQVVSGQDADSVYVLSGAGTLNLDRFCSADL